MDIKVLLVDDEKGMRLLLTKILDKNSAFKVVGECDNVTDALTEFINQKPEVVFLDVEMPTGSGLDLAKSIADIDPKVKIIFATAHGEYMSEAFQVYAFDYLVKPFKIERVLQTLDRIKEIHPPKAQDELDKIIRKEKGLEKLMVKNKDSLSLIDTNDIVLIQREDNNTVIYTKDDSFFTSVSLAELEEKLDVSQFLRCHKSYIINLSKISKIYPYGRWTYIVKLKDTEKDALITHEKYEDIKKIFSC